MKLTHNVELNHLIHVHLNQKALAQTEVDKHKFYISEHNNLGAQHIIEITHPTLMLQASTENVRAFGYTMAELTGWLHRWNYRLYRIEDSGTKAALAGGLGNYQNLWYEADE